MKGNFDFFGMHRSSDPETSKEAAWTVDAKTLSKMVLRAIVSGPKTSEEVAEYLGRPVVSISPRFAPLERAGFICKSETKRAGRSGAKRVVWEITLLGVDNAD